MDQIRADSPPRPVSFGARSAGRGTYDVVKIAAWVSALAVGAAFWAAVALALVH